MKLKPCPFCGSNELQVLHIRIKVLLWYVSCDGCATTGPEGRTESEAEELWNTRVEG